MSDSVFPAALGSRPDKYCLDPGHGGRHPGAVFRGMAEKDIVLPVALELRSLLVTGGHTVIMTRHDDSTQWLSRRAKLANDQGADLFISLHMNADQDDDSEGMPEAHGQEIWWWKDEDRELAEAIEVGMRRIYPTERFRGCKRGNLSVLRNADMPACLVELAFIDNSESARRMAHPLEQREAALAIYLGLLRREQRIRQGTVFE